MSRPSLALSLQFADATHRALLPRHKVARWIRAALERPAEITVRIVGADEGRALNRDYRGKDYATNVLTFDYSHEPVVVADLIIAAPVVAAEAQQMGIALEAHYAHLLVHGSLHAQGYDHEDDAEAAQMEARESELLRGLGYPDPYAGGGSVQRVERAGAAPAAAPRARTLTAAGCSAAASPRRARSRSARRPPPRA